jgi:hypothetical protein
MKQGTGLMTKNIYVVPIEPIDTRYTRQWYEHIPLAIDSAAKAQGVDVNVVVVNGEQVPPVPTPGAFLDFGATNIYKSSQLAAIAAEFQNGKIKDGDCFLFTDAWNPTVISVKYMAELLGKKINLHGMWHAGSYDPQDFLGRLIGAKPWVRHSETAMFYSYDTNWFATDFHVDMFIKNMFGPFTKEAWEPSFDEVKEQMLSNKRIGITGWPMDYLVPLLEPYSRLEKRPMIVFPHRIAPEKQLEIFKDLEASMPEYEWKVCQETPLTKHEYHTILGSSTMVFSANLQETYGISMIEGLLCDSFPLVPSRLSYVEMWNEEFTYPDEWTSDWSSYLTNREKLIAKIRSIMNLHKNNVQYINEAKVNQRSKIDLFINATPMIKSLIN